jgi:hypothetical protein
MVPTQERIFLRRESRWTSTLDHIGQIDGDFLVQVPCAAKYSSPSPVLVGVGVSGHGPFHSDTKSLLFLSDRTLLTCQSYNLHCSDGSRNRQM